MEAKALNRLVTDIIKDSAKQRDKIQAALIGCAYQVQFHNGNLDPLIRLLDGVGNNVNRKAMSHWISVNAPVHFVDGAPKVSVQRAKECTATEAEFLIDLETRAPWYDFAKRTNTTSNAWDSEAEAKKVAEYLHKAYEKAVKNDSALAALLKGVDLQMAAIITKIESMEKAEV